MKSDTGSVAPLGIGLSAILLATILTLVSANSLYLLRTRLNFVAEFAALSEVKYALSASDFLSATQNSGSVFVEDDSSIDLKTVEVTICSLWSSPVPVLSQVGTLRICGHGAARGG